jgi:carbon storage regulator
MLYITRRIGETVVINNDIEITVLEVIGKKVKLGCSFPKNSTVFRKELFDKISQENIAAITEIEGEGQSILPEPSLSLKKPSKE